MSTILSMVAQVTSAHWLIVASFANVLAGLVLGMCLVMLVAAVGDQFSSTSVVEVSLPIDPTRNIIMHLPCLGD